MNMDEWNMSFTDMWYFKFECGIPTVTMRVNVTVFSVFMISMGAHLDFPSSEYRSNEQLEVRDVEYGCSGSQLCERIAV